MCLSAVGTREWTLQGDCETHILTKDTAKAKTKAKAKALAGLALTFVPWACQAFAWALQRLPVHLPGTEPF